ncbi:glycosyltransferase [Pseudobacter ginsenosidimutans]|uniref:Glycosyl transferase family 2 n=1 Tax=Pseudobacter ginsenosidimutans TaxID=661488 RepID=A0A4Q7MQH3_9BACT|nr:glycosyltransferase [Pseudobacter ginsenosidimutans]QEC42202.1 glycosyltransferase [Pseudobacter ginsenosidimutans]RZS70955.1 glycosyl transferase family 2 [Pseudobacter ginsenosidimutans]
MPDFFLLIPCYNNTEGLIRSLQSVQYPMHRYKVVVVDDGSREPVSDKLLLEKISPDLQLQVIRQPKNGGITLALNTGLEAIHSQATEGFIARLDCGDLCTPDRFEKQVSFLQANPQVQLLGSWCYFKNFTTGENYKYRTPVDDKEIQRKMYFKNVFIHPTVMWRFNSASPVYYPYDFPHAEDYGIFYELLKRGAGAVIPEFMVTCEINEKGISISNRQAQYKSRMQVIRKYGTSRWLTLMGTIKLGLLMLVPQRILLPIKKALYS